MATLKELREAAGLTQFDLAVKTGLTPGAISVLERQAAKPRPATMDALRAALGPEVDSIEWAVTKKRRRPYLERQRAQREGQS